MDCFESESIQELLNKPLDDLVSSSRSNGKIRDRNENDDSLSGSVRRRMSVRRKKNHNQFLDYGMNIENKKSMVSDFPSGYPSRNRTISERNHYGRRSRGGDQKDEKLFNRKDFRSPQLWQPNQTKNNYENYNDTNNDNISDRFGNETNLFGNIGFNDSETSGNSSLRDILESKLTKLQSRASRFGGTSFSDIDKYLDKKVIEDRIDVDATDKSRDSDKGIYVWQSNGIKSIKAFRQLVTSILYNDAVRGQTSSSRDDLSIYRVNSSSLVIVTRGNWIKDVLVLKLSVPLLNHPPWRKMIDLDVFESHHQINFGGFLGDKKFQGTYIRPATDKDMELLTKHLVESIDTSGSLPAQIWKRESQANHEIKIASETSRSSGPPHDRSSGQPNSRISGLTNSRNNGPHHINDQRRAHMDTVNDNMLNRVFPRIEFDQSVDSWQFGGNRSQNSVDYNDRDSEEAFFEILSSSKSSFTDDYRSIVTRELS